MQQKPGYKIKGERIRK